MESRQIAVCQGQRRPSGKETRATYQISLVETVVNVSTLVVILAALQSCSDWDGATSSIDEVSVVEEVQDRGKRGALGDSSLNGC
jgi:hypothetical protein